MNPANFGLGSYVEGRGRVGHRHTQCGAWFLQHRRKRGRQRQCVDHAWVQDTSGNAVNINGIVGDFPVSGIIWDLGGQANQVAVFVFVDHGPVPGEVLENTAWLGNDPNGALGDWTQASLVHVYGSGWEDDPTISDGFVAVYQLPTADTFRYVSVTWVAPAPSCATATTRSTPWAALISMVAASLSVAATFPNP